jgi:hydroxyacylglutathione hydrolase
VGFVLTEKGILMPIQIHMLTLGALQTNCFIVGDTDTGEAVIIDPSAEAEKILGVVEQQGYTVREILITHGHFDHVLASGPVKEATQAPLRIHEADAPALKQSQSIAQMYGLPSPPPAAPDSQINSGDVFEVASIKLETVYTPGHSPGHVSFILASEQAVFSGDCLFAGGIGRTDLPGGNYEALMQSIEEQLLTLDDAYTVCCGHGSLTTIGQERQSNPFILQWQARQ